MPRNPSNPPKADGLFSILTHQLRRIPQVLWTPVGFRQGAPEEKEQERLRAFWRLPQGARQCWWLSWWVTADLERVS